MKWKRFLFALTCLVLLQTVCFGQKKLSSRNLNAQIKKAVQTYFSNELGRPDSEVVVEYAEPIIFKTASPEWDGVQVLPNRQKVRKGSQVIKIGLFLNGQLLHRAGGKIRVLTFENVVVAGERLARHVLIGPNHLAVERRETTRIKSSDMLSLDDIVGRRTTRIVQPGEIIGASMIEVKPAVTRGEPIDIRFIKGAIEIVLPGVARQDGYIGGKIRVKCLETKKLFVADVLDSRTVIVNL